MRIAVIHGDLEKPFPYYPNQDWDSNDNSVLHRLHEALALLREHSFEFFSAHDTLWRDLQRCRAEYDLVLNLCDDGFMNDPDRALHVCAMLDVLGVPYTGSGVVAMAMTADKQAQLCVARELSVRVPDTVLVGPGQLAPPDIMYPVIVKPNTTDGSVGINARSVVHDAAGLAAALHMIRAELRLSCAVLVQEYLPGAELGVSILGNSAQDLRALPVTEEDYSVLPPDLPKILGYEAKWQQTSPYWQIQTRRAAPPPEVQAYVLESSFKLYGRFRLRDYARFDWRLNGRGEPVFLEANANCGWCWDGHLAKAAAFAGMSYSELLGAILLSAARRWALAPAHPC
jgi:D-alanine-D-alanine ligase